MTDTLGVDLVRSGLQVFKTRLYSSRAPIVKTSYRLLGSSRFLKTTFHPPDFTFLVLLE